MAFKYIDPPMLYITIEALKYLDDIVYYYYHQHYVKFKNNEFLYKIKILNTFIIEETTLDHKQLSNCAKCKLDDYISKYDLELKDIKCFEKEYIHNQIKLLR